VKDSKLLIEGYPDDGQSTNVRLAIRLESKGLGEDQLGHSQHGFDFFRQREREEALTATLFPMTRRAGTWISRRSRMMCGYRVIACLKRNVSSSCCDGSVPLMRQCLAPAPDRQYDPRMLRSGVDGVLDDHRQPDLATHGHASAETVRLCADVDAPSILESGVWSADLNAIVPKMSNPDDISVRGSKLNAAWPTLKCLLAPGIDHRPRGQSICNSSGMRLSVAASMAEGVGLSTRFPSTYCSVTIC
jgi:hypothetical protein